MIKHPCNTLSNTLVHAFITSNLDYCNSVLYSISKHQINKLQHIQNAAARLVRNKHKFEHITPVLKDLHWLKIEQRIEYKTILLTFKARHGLAPQYLKDLLTVYVPKRILRSSNTNLYKVPRSRTNTIGPRAFKCSAPVPTDLRCVEGLESFKKGLKYYSL